MTSMNGFIAATRFGMGAAPGDLAAIGNDGRAWVEAQLAPQPLPAMLASLPNSSQRYDEFKQLQLIKRQAKQQAAATTEAPAAGPLAQSQRRPGQPVPQAPPPGSPLAGDPDVLRIRDIYLEEAGARTRAAVASPTPVVERLTQFWSNHFTVSIARGVVAPLAGSYEREAIRPHLFGRFHDMLRAVAAHPAMLLYLDNAQSIGPDSPQGLRSGRGINENLAREMMELHTLGVNGGYSQSDVIQLARILTGWSVAGPRETGGFVWRPRIHEPGDKVLLGAHIANGGQQEGEQALLILSRHPATARHVATQLARHFIADDPPPAVVAAVAKAFTDSDGDLAHVTRTLVARPEAWSQALPKVKSPNDYVVSILRAAGTTEAEDKVLVQALRLLGQAPFAAAQPEGWPDDAAGWLGPDSLMRRIEWAKASARRLVKVADPQQMAEAALGPVLRPATRDAIAAAPDKPTQLAMLLVSPEFQRR